MGKIIKLFVGLIVLMIAGIIGVTALSNTDGVIGDIASDARNAAVNVALDASGAKNRSRTRSNPASTRSPPQPGSPRPRCSRASTTWPSRNGR